MESAIEHSAFMYNQRKNARVDSKAFHVATAKIQVYPQYKNMPDGLLPIRTQNTPAGGTSQTK